MQQIFTAHIEKDEDTDYYIGIVPSVPGAYTQAKTLDELNVCLQEVLELCSASLSEDEKKDIPKFIGIQQIAIAV
jgi:predicted RNase H-like HicB family nuclease